MIKSTELRIGNLVEVNGIVSEIIEIRENTLRVSYLDRFSFIDYEKAKPIPVNEEWALKLPKKIKFVHELQNWHYWNNSKKELELIL